MYKAFCEGCSFCLSDDINVKEMSACLAYVWG